MIEGWYDFTLKETGIRIDYVLLLILLFLIFIIYSRLVVSKEEKSIYERNYWLYAIVPIIAFSLIEGLRYARGVDYIGYVYTYLQSLDPKVENEPLFMLLNKGMLLMGFPYCIAFVVYYLFWIVGILHLCENFRYLLCWCIPFALIASIPSMENLVRQFVSLSFVMISLSFLLKKKYVMSCFWAVISFGFHLSSVIVVVIIYTVYIIGRKECFKLKSSLIAYFFFFFIFDISFLDIFVLNVFPLLDLGDLKFSGYIENADKWFTSSAIREDYIRSVWGNIALFLFDISLIIMGRKSIQHEKNTKNEKALIIVYNLFVIGAIGMQAVMELEIMRRFFRPLYMLWFVLAANILYRYPLQKKLKSKWVIVGNYIILGYILCVLFGKYILFTPSQMFIWDSFKYRL